MKDLTKELTIEQKAQRYDEAIDVARKIKNGEPIDVPDGTVIPVVIFPELEETEESEDEKIRKVLVGFFKNYKEQGTIGAEMFNGISTGKILAWLEKQGKQKPVWSEEDERISKTIIIGIENEMFGDEMRETYQRIPNLNKDYYQIRIDWLKSLKDRINI